MRWQADEWLRSTELVQRRVRALPPQPMRKDRRRHKTLLAAIIAQGERLLQRAQEPGGLPDNLDGIKTPDLDAMVEELRTTQLQWEGDMTPQRREQILKELFDVRRPGHAASDPHGSGLDRYGR